MNSFTDRLTWKDIRVMRAVTILEQMPQAKRIDQSFQRSISRWAAWRRKQKAEEAVTAKTTAELRQERAA